jgi:hypothetical protein
VISKYGRVQLHTGVITEARRGMRAMFKKRKPSYRLSIVLVLLFSLLFLSGCAWLWDIINFPSERERREEIKKVSGITLPKTEAENVITTSEGEQILSDIVSIIFKEGVRQEVKEAVAESIGGTIEGEIPQINVVYIKFALPKSKTEIKGIIESLKEEPSVESASLEYLIEVDSAIPDTLDIEKLLTGRNGDFLGWKCQMHGMRSGKPVLTCLIIQ